MASTFRSPLEEMVDQLFSEIKAKRGESRDNPVTGGDFVWGIDPITAQKKEAIAALSAREWFAANSPPDAPPLPLSDQDVDDYRNARGLAGIVGFFARSLSRQGYGRQRYDISKHPSFDDFARGLMAMAVDSGGLWGLENDARLKTRFPPRPLAGMTPGAYWAPPREYAELQRRGAA
jgi:hypothetical protein